LLHCPPNLLASFQHAFLNALSRACGEIEEGAVAFKLIGGGNPTLKAVLGKLAYMSKGADRSTADRFGIRQEQRASISQDLGPATTVRHVTVNADQAVVTDQIVTGGPRAMGGTRDDG